MAKGTAHTVEYLPTFLAYKIPVTYVRKIWVFQVGPFEAAGCKLSRRDRQTISLRKVLTPAQVIDSSDDEEEEEDPDPDQSLQEDPDPDQSVQEDPNGQNMTLDQLNQWIDKIMKAQVTAKRYPYVTYRNYLYKF